MGFDVPRPIVEFFGIFVGVDPDQWPKGSESALRDYAQKYESIAAQLRSGVGSQAQQAANSLAVAWNGEGGRALSHRITNYATRPDAGGVETIAAHLDAVARHLRDTADEIFRHKVEMWAQAAIGAAMFFIPGLNAISKIPGLKNLLAKRFQKWLAGRIGQVVSKLIASLASKAPKLPPTAVKVLRSNIAKNIGLGVPAATLFGLGPNTVAQTAGLMTGKDGRSVHDEDGRYVGHEEGWNGEETETYLKITAAALPIAGAVGLGANALGNRMVPNPSKATAFVGRRLRGGAAMGVSLPAANYAVTGHPPTGEEFWRAAAMGAAMPTHPVKPLIDGIRGMANQHAMPLEPVRDFTEIVPGDRPPDPPPDGAIGVEAPAGGGAAHQNTTPMAAEIRASEPATGVMAPGVVAGLHGAEAAHPSGRAAHAEPSARTPPRTTTPADGTTATSVKPGATGGDGSGRPPGGGHSTEVEGGTRPGGAQQERAGEQNTKAPVEEPGSKPDPVGEQTGKPVPAGEQNGKPVPAGEQNAKPDPVGEHNGRPVPAEESGPRNPGPDENLRAAERDRPRTEDPADPHPPEIREPPAPDRPAPPPDHVGKSDAVDSPVLTEHQQEAVRRAAAARAAEQAYFAIARNGDTLPVEAPYREVRQSAKDFRAADKAVERQEKAVDRLTHDLEAARKDEQKPTEAAEKATRQAEAAAATARERAEAWQRELEQAGERLEAAEAKRAEAREVAEGRRAELEAWLEAQEKRVSWLVAEQDYALSRLGPEQLQQLFHLELDGWGHLAPHEQRMLAIHEMIHRRFHKALYPGQIKAALAAGADMLVQAPCGFGKTFAFVLAAGTAAGDHPVHLMTSQRNLAGRDHLTYREILEPLGVDVVLVDPNRTYAHPSRPTVYMGGADSFGWSLSGERQMRADTHRVPGDHLMIDEVDGVAIDLATQRYTHSDGAAGRAGAETEAGVHLAKWALDSGAFDKGVHFGLSEPGSQPRLTLEGRQRLRELIGADAEAVRHFDDVVRHLENDARQRWVDRYRERRDYEVADVNGERRIVILNPRNDAPLIDPITLAEQRWPGVAQALEVRHGLEVRNDPRHISEVTTLDVLGRYERMSGMSGTVAEARQAMLDLYGDRFSEVIEIGEHNASKRIDNVEQHYTTWREKWSAMADQTIAELVKDGDPSRGRPQLVLLPNEEITPFTRLLKQRLAERGVEQQVDLQVVDARRQIEFADAGRYDAAMREAGQQTGRPGTITVGNRDLARGFDPKPDRAAFGGFRAPAPGSRVFTIEIEQAGTTIRLEPTEGGIHNRVGFRDPDSPRGTTQAVNRVGRQGAPGEATVYTSSQDSLFQNRSDALQAAVAYRDSAGVARRDAAVQAYTEAVFAHARTLGAVAQDGSDPVAAAESQGTSEAVRRAAEALDRAEESLRSGEYQEYNRNVEAAQRRAQESDIVQIRSQAPGRVEHTAVPKAQGESAPADGARPAGLRFSESPLRLPEEVVTAVAAITGSDPVLIEGLRPLLESPRFRALGAEGMRREIASLEGLGTQAEAGQVSPAYAELFGRSLGFGAEVSGPPMPREIPAHPSDLAEAVDVSDRLEPLPQRSSSAGNAGKVASEDAHAGAYLIRGLDGADWVVKLYPDRGGFRHDAEVELAGLRAGYLTGFGPPPHGLVRAEIEGRSYVGVAMAPVQGGLIEAETRDADPEAAAAAIREAAAWREAVTFDTVHQLDLFGRRLLELGYSARYHLQPFVDADGDLRPIDLARVAALPEDAFYRQYWIDKHHREIAECRRDLLAAAVENARRRQDTGTSDFAGQFSAESLSFAEKEAVARAAFDALDLPQPVRDKVRLVVRARHPHAERSTREHRGHFEPKPDGRAELAVFADGVRTRAEVEQTVLHEAGHLVFAACNPAERAAIHRAIGRLPDDAVLVRTWRQEIERLYARQRAGRSDDEFQRLVDEELLSRAYAHVVQESGGVPSRLRTWFDGFVTGAFGQVCVRLGLVEPAALKAAESRRDHDLAPFYRILRTALRGLHRQQGIHPGDHGPGAGRDDLRDRDGRDPVEESVRRLLHGRPDQLPGSLAGVRRILPLDERTYLVGLASGFAFRLVVGAGSTPDDKPYQRDIRPDDNLAELTLSSVLASDDAVAGTMDAAIRDIVEQLLRPFRADRSPVTMLLRVRVAMKYMARLLPAGTGITSIAWVDDVTYLVQYADGRLRKVVVVAGPLHENESIKVVPAAEDGTTIVIVSNRLEVGREPGAVAAALGLLDQSIAREDSDRTEAALLADANAVLSDPASPALRGLGIERMTRLSDTGWEIALTERSSITVTVGFDRLDEGVPYRLTNDLELRSAHVVLPRRPGGPEGMTAAIGAALGTLRAEYAPLTDNGQEVVRWAREALDERRSDPLVRVAGDLYQKGSDDGTAYQFAVTSARLPAGVDYDVGYEPSLHRGVVVLAEDLDVRARDAALTGALDRLAHEAARAVAVDDGDTDSDTGTDPIPELPGGRGGFEVRTHGGIVTVDVAIGMLPGPALYTARFDSGFARLHVTLAPELTRQEGRYALRTIVGRLRRGLVPELPPAGGLFTTRGRTDPDPAAVLAAAEAVLASDGLAEQTGITGIVSTPSGTRIAAGDVEFELSLTSELIADGSPANATYRRLDDGRIRLRLALSDLATPDEVDAILRRHLGQMAVLAEDPGRPLDRFLPFSHTVEPGPQSLDDELPVLLAEMAAAAPRPGDSWADRILHVSDRAHAVLAGESEHSVDGIAGARLLDTGEWLLTLDNGLSLVVDLVVDSIRDGAAYQLGPVVESRLAIKVSDELSGDAIVAATLGAAVAGIVEQFADFPAVTAAAEAVGRWAHRQLTDPDSAVRGELGEAGVREVTEVTEGEPGTFRFRLADGRTREVLVTAGCVDDLPYLFGRVANADGTRALLLSHELLGLAAEDREDVDIARGLLLQGLRDVLPEPTVAARIVGGGFSEQDIVQFAEYVRQWWWTRNRAPSDEDLESIIDQIVAGLPGAGPGEQQRDTLRRQAAELMLTEAQRGLRERSVALDRAEAEVVRRAAADPASESDTAALDSALHALRDQAALVVWLKLEIAAARAGRDQDGTRGPEFQQQVVEELLRGKPRGFDTDRWGPAIDQALPGRDHNCPETALAHAKTRSGEPAAAPPPVGPDGASFAAARLEIELGGRLQRLVEIAGATITAGEAGTALLRLERALREAGDGATALIVYRPAGGGPGHVLVAEYNNGPDTPAHVRDVTYFDWERGGRLSGRPDLTGVVAEISAFVIDAGRNAVPVRDEAGTILGRGIGNAKPPTPAYAPHRTEYLAWMRELAAELGRPDAGDLPLAGTAGQSRGSPPEEWERRFDAELAAAEAESGVRLQPLADVRDGRADEPSEAVLDAIDRVESTVSNRTAVRDATERVAAARRRIDAARFATPPMRRQLRRAEAALDRARTVQRRAYVVMTREDGSVLRALVENDRGRPRYVHLNGQTVDRTVVLAGRPIDGGTVIRGASADVVTVRALAVTDDLAPVGFAWRSLGGPTATQHAGALDGPPISPLPYLDEVAAYFTRQLQERGADGTVDPTELGQRLLSEYRQLISGEGEVVKLGGHYFRARLVLTDPRRVVTSVTPVEGVSASFPQVGHMQDRSAAHTTRRVVGADVPIGPVTVGGTLQWNTSLDVTTTAGVHAGLAVTNNRGPAYPIEYAAAWQLSPIDLGTRASEHTEHTTVISAETTTTPGTLVVAVPDTYIAETEPTHTVRLDESEWRPARELPSGMRLEIVGRTPLARELLDMLPEKWRADREVVEQVLDHVKELTDRFHDTVRTSGRGRAPEGYAFDLTVRGRPIAVVSVTGEVLREQVRLLGRPMKQIKEDVGVGQHSATASVTAGRSGTLSGSLSATRFVPRWLARFVEKAVSVEVGGSRGRRRARGAGMSMTALRVKVDKMWPGGRSDTSFNQAYEVGARFTVSVKRASDGEEVGGPRVVDGSAKLVLRESEAYRYGLPVDRSAVLDNGEVRGAPRTKDAEGNAIDLPFPAHLRAAGKDGRDGEERGLGSGFGAVRHFSLDVPEALTERSNAVADAVRAQFPGGSWADGTATLREMVLQLLGAPTDHRGRRRDQEIENNLNAERQLDEDSVRQLYDDLAQDGVRLTFQRFEPKGLDPHGLGAKLVGAEDLHVDLRLEQRIGEAEFLGLGDGVVAAELPIDMSSVGSTMLGERSRSLSGALKFFRLFALKGAWSWSSAAGVSAALRANRVRLLETKEGREFAGWRVPHTLTATVTDGRGNEVATLSFTGSAETWMLADLARLAPRPEPPVLGAGESVAEVLTRHGEVIAVDSTGVRAALRDAGPWLPADIVDALSSNDFIRANVRGIAERGVTLEGATRGQTDRQGRNLVVLPRTRWNATVGAEVGEISLLGETDSVLGANIMLRLPTTETSGSRSSGWTGGVNVGKTYAGDLTRTSTKGESVSTGSTFGVEDINLGLERRFVLNVPVTWVVESTRVTLGRGWIVGSPEVAEPRKVSGGNVVALVSESELVDMYGRGVIELPDREVARSLQRWHDGELSLADRRVVTRAALRLAERQTAVQPGPDLALLRSVLGQYDGHPYDRHPGAYLGEQRFCERCSTHPDGRRETVLSPERAGADAIVAELRRLLDEHRTGRLPVASIESRRRGVPEWIDRGAGIGVAGIDEVVLEGDRDDSVGSVGSVGLDEHLRTVLGQAIGGIFDGVGGPVETGRALGKLPNVDGMMSVLGGGERAHSHLRDAIGTEYPLLETEIPRSFVSLLRLKRRPGADHIKLTMRADLVSPESLGPDEYRRLAQRLGELGLPTAPENLGPALDSLFRYQAYGFLTAAIARSRGDYWNGELARPVPGVGSREVPFVGELLRGLGVAADESTFGMNRKTATSVGGSSSHSTPETQINVQSLFAAVVERLDLPIRLTLRAYRSDMTEPVVEREVVGRMRVRQQADFAPMPQESERHKSYRPIEEIPLDHVGIALDDGGGQTRHAVMRMLSDSEMLGKRAAEELKTYLVDRGPFAHDGLLISLRRLFSDAGATLTVHPRSRPRERCTVTVRFEGYNPTAVRRADRVRLGQIHRREEKDGTKIGVRPPVPGQSMVEGKLYATFKGGLGAQAELAVTTWDGWRDEMSGDTEGAGVVVRLDYAAYLEGERRVDGTVRQRLRMPNAAHGRLYVLVYEKDLPAFESRYGRIEAAADAEAARTRALEIEARAPELSLEDLLESVGRTGEPVDAVSTGLRGEVRALEPGPRSEAGLGPAARPLVGLAVDPLQFAVTVRTALADRIRGAADALTARAQATADACAEARRLADDLDERATAVLRARELVRTAEDPARRAEQILAAAVALREARSDPDRVDAAREQVELALLSPDERRRHFRHALLRWQRFFPGGVEDMRAAMAEAYDIAEFLGLPDARDGEPSRAPGPLEGDLDVLGLVRDVAVRVGAEIVLTVTEPDGSQSRHRISPYVGGIVREDLTDQNERLEHAVRDLIRQDAPAFLRAGRLRLDLADLLEESTATGLPFAEVVANARNVPAERAALATPERARWEAILPELRRALVAAEFTGVHLAQAMLAEVDLEALFASSQREGGDLVADLVRLKTRLADMPEGGPSSFEEFEEIALLFGFGRADLPAARRVEELTVFRQILIDAGLRDGLTDPSTARLLRNLAGELVLRYGLFAPEQRRRVLEVCREWPAAALATRPARPDAVETLPGGRSEGIPRLDEEHREQLDATLRWIVERYYHGVPIGHAYRGAETLDAGDLQRVREALWRFGVPYAARLAAQLPGSRFDGDLSAQNFRVEVADPNTPSARQQRWIDAAEAETRWVPHGTDGFFEAVFAVLREDGGRELERLRAEYGVESPRQLREGLANAVGARPRHRPDAPTLLDLIPDLAGLGLKPSGAVDQIRDSGAAGSPLYARLPMLLAEHYGLRIAVCDDAGHVESHGRTGSDADPGPRIRLLRIADQHYMPVLGGAEDAPGRPEDREDGGPRGQNRPTVRTTDHLGRVDHLPQRVPGQHLAPEPALSPESRLAEIVRSAAGDDPVRLEGLRPLLASPELQRLDPHDLSALAESWASLEYVELFRRLADHDVDVPGAPPLPVSAERPPSDWDRAIDVGRELRPLPSRLSSAGDAGHVAQHDDNAGVYSIQRDGVPWVVKLAPDSARHRADATAELEGLYGAALTGYGPVPYGLVTAELGHGSERRSYVGVAMAPVQGGFITPVSTDPAAQVEAERWRSAVTFDTVRQFEHYLRRLREAGYRYTHDPQCFVDADGNIRPIDFEGVGPQAGGSAGDQLIRFDVAGLRRPLLEAAVENGRRSRDQA